MTKTVQSKSEGTNQYANGYDVQIAKQVAKELGKTVSSQNVLNGLIPALTSGKIGHDYSRYEPNCRAKKEIAFQIATILVSQCYLSKR